MRSRWGFVLTAIMLAVSAAPPASARAQGGGLKFETYRDAKSQFRWRLKGANGAVMATGGEGYKAKADLERGIQVVQQAGAAGSKSKFETFQDARNEFRWRLKASNGRVVAESSESYKNKADCEAAIERIRQGAAKAPVVEASP